MNQTTTSTLLAQNVIVLTNNNNLTDTTNTTNNACSSVVVGESGDDHSHHCLNQQLDIFQWLEMLNSIPTTTCDTSNDGGGVTTCNTANDDNQESSPTTTIQSNMQSSTASPASAASVLTIDKEYPLSLHEECDKLYSKYMESCGQNHLNEGIPQEEDDSLSIFKDGFFKDDLPTTNDFESSIDFELTDLRLESSTEKSPIMLTQELSKPLTDLLFNSDESYKFGNRRVLNAASSVVVNKKRQREWCRSNHLNVPSLPINYSSNKKVKTKLSQEQKQVHYQPHHNGNSCQGQITWHHVSIDSKMNQQENTFVYENSFNLFDSFTPGNSISQQMAYSNNSMAGGGETVPTCFSAIIIETAESISKKMKRGRPKKE